MELKDRVVVITERNINDLHEIYGKMNTNELERTINTYIASAMEEIREDYQMESNKKFILKDCSFDLPEGFKGNYANALMLLAIRVLEDLNNGKIVIDENASTKDCLGLISLDKKYAVNCKIE